MKKKKSFIQKNGPQVTRKPPTNAWIGPNVPETPDADFLASLPPFPVSVSERARIWCHNCYQQHDPALCLGPLNEGTTNACVFCGKLHLCEDCTYYTFPRFMQYAWYMRQGRPPARTRISLSDFPVSQLPPGQQALIVAPVQRANFARAIGFESMKLARLRTVPFFWKGYQYPQEEAPHVEALKAIQRFHQGAEKVTIIRFGNGARMGFGPGRSVDLRQGQQPIDPRTYKNRRLLYIEEQEAHRGLTATQVQSTITRPALLGLVTAQQEATPTPANTEPAAHGGLSVTQTQHTTPRPAIGGLEPQDSVTTHSAAIRGSSSTEPEVLADQNRNLEEKLVAKSWEELEKFKMMTLRH